MQGSPGRSLQGNGGKVIFGNKAFFYLEELQKVCIMKLTENRYEDKRLVILMSLYAILHKYYIQII